MKTFTEAPPADHDVGRQITGLYQAHAHGLVKMAVLMVGDQLTAEDIVQEAFLSLYHRWRTLRDKDKALSYLRSGVLNGCRDIHRTRYRRQAIALNHLHFLGSADAAASAEEEAVLAEAQREVLAALRHLPVRQREAVALRYILDLSEAQTAEAMGVALGTVKSATSRGLDHLARLLNATREAQ